MEKGKIYQNVEVHDYSFLGMGVVKIENFTIFVPYVRVGEIVTIEITKLKKNYGFAKTIDYKPCKVGCEYYYKCGSCNLMHIDYPNQVILKQQVIANLIKKNMLHTKLEDFSSAKDSENYRNKIALPVHNIDGKLSLGYFQRDTHKLIPIEKCLLAKAEINQLITPIETALNSCEEQAYNYKYKSGNVRHVIIRSNGENVMVIIVTNRGKLKNEHQFINILKEHQNIKSIIINTQKSNERAILGSKNRVIYGANSLAMNFGGKVFMAEPNAFFQVNEDVANQILEYIQTLTSFENKNVIDAFCGTGTIGLALADASKSILGIEIEPEAIRCAKLNQKLLGIENATYICDDIEKTIVNIDINTYNIAIVDPPRSGLAQNMKQALIAMNLEEVIYISCDPSTLIRDISELVTHYEVISIKGFDMFPNTNHIETVAYLKLRKEHDDKANNFSNRN